LSFLDGVRLSRSVPTAPRLQRLRLEAARADFVPAALLRAYLVALKIWALGYCSTRSLLGRSKTWRGLAAAVILAACAAVLMSLPWQLGALAAASAMAGDCLSSFVKRRFGLEPSSMTLGLDQVPESLFPAVACSGYLPLGPLDVALIVLVFSVGELATSRLLFAIGLRDRPY